MLQKNGTFVDAAIATLLCEGVANPQSMGLGGGFLAAIYKRCTGTVEMLNAREIAPMAANLSMFANPAISGSVLITNKIQL